MPSRSADADAWKRLVLKSMSPPGWLKADGPHRDIVLSTRCRFMRNLRGYRYPHHATLFELAEIEGAVKESFRGEPFQTADQSSPAERDYLVACRLVSPDFQWNAPGRAVLLNPTRTVSVMVNEEDHLRIQALASGWSFRKAIQEAEQVLELLNRKLSFSRSERFGYLAASASNTGDGLRYSAMFHLIGLAHNRRLSTVMRALQSQSLVVRGLFGERSRAIGAFVQVSSTASSVPQFVGACDFLIDEEARARTGVPQQMLLEKASQANDFLQASQSMTLSDSLRVLAWRRWAGGASPRQTDLLLPELALMESLGEPRAGRARVDLLRRT